jgi:transposase InsO family protein
MAHGFQYLVAIIDVGSRKTLSWRVSNTMTPDFCLEALQEALGKYGKPEIFNTDQGSQFTSREWIDTLKAAGVQISMDGKGRWIDNVFIERLWRLCAQGDYVADSGKGRGFSVDARRMRAHNERGLGVHCKGPRGQKDDCERVGAGRTRCERRVRRPFAKGTSASPAATRRRATWPDPCAEHWRPGVHIA